MIHYCRYFIESQIPLGFVYTVYIKVRYHIDKLFMAGNQFGFDFNSTKDIYDLQDILKDRLKHYFAEYKLVDADIEYVQLTFRKLDKKLFSEFCLDKPQHVDRSVSISTNRKLNIPVSVAESSLGRPLPVVIVNNFIINISLNIDNKMVNFLDIIRNKAKFFRPKHPDNITYFDNDYMFYFLKDEVDYVLAIKYIEYNSIEKIRYSLSGVVINRVIDKIENNLVIRKAGEKEIVLDNNKISIVKQNKLKAIEKPKSKVLFVSNPNIGVIDIETYLTNEGISKVYALGFKTNLDNDPIIYYIDKDLNSSKLVLSMIDELLRPKYSNISFFFCHNLAGYDIAFILKVLYDYNDNHKDKYNISCILRDDKIIKVRISKDKHSFTINDSYCMLTDSLRSLGESFEVSTLKYIFPYRFSTKDHLFYIGNTPDYEYYEKDDITKEEHSKIYSGNWSFYDETIKYLKDDLCSLYEILLKANKQIFKDYDINMTDYLTISSLAVAIFFKSYYHNNIPCFNKSSLYKDVKEGYYGGITEVYEPCGYNLYYYDVNSLYPYVALQDMPGL